MILRVILVFSCLLGCLPISVAAAEDFLPFKEEVTAVTSFDQVKLSAQWAIPAYVNAVAVIFQGSGNVGLDGDVSSPLVGSGYRGAPAKLSNQLAAQLAQIGVASLRFSKRGVDDPTQLPNQTMPYMIKDASAALRDARARFSGLKTILVGFSEGALVATALAAENPVDALFLLGLPTRSIDELLAYQFLEWPVELIRSRIDQKHDGQITTQELAALGAGKLPLLGTGFAGADWQSLDANHDGVLSVATELVPAYQQLYSVLNDLVQTPAFYGWYNSLRDMATFSTLAAQISAPVFLYEGQDDAQVKWSWAAADQRYFRGKTKFHLFSKLGHCFSPMDGTIGEVKSSGPLSDDLLSALAIDVSGAL